MRHTPLPGPRGLLVALIASLLLVAGAAGPVRAQQASSSIPEETRREILEKLRQRTTGLGTVGSEGDSIPADSAAAPADTVAGAEDAEPEDEAEPKDVNPEDAEPEAAELASPELVDATGAAPIDTTAPAAESDSAQAPPIGGAAADSIMAVMSEIPGYTAMRYEGSAIRYDAAEGAVELVGEAKVSRATESMTADSLLVFDQNRETVCGYGSPVLTGPDKPVESDQVCYDIEDKIGLALGARTEFTENATWYLHGDEVYTQGSHRIYGEHTDFTSCDLEVPHYHFSAGRVKVVRDSVMVARDITINFGDVPVMWLPFMMQSMKQGRRSGLLMPSVGVNDIARTSSGHQREIRDIGFYWAINDYMGAKVAFGWASRNWKSLTGTLDYRWTRQFLNGTASFRQYWREEGGTEVTLRANTSWRPGERTSVRVSANYASNSQFLRQNTFDPREMNRSIDSNAGLTHRFDWGTLNLSARRKQYLHDNKVERTLPDVGLSLQPITLFEAPTGEASWYNNATWSGSANIKSRATDLDEALAEAGQLDRVQRDASLRSSFSMGNLSWSQSVSVDEALRGDPERFGGQGLSPLAGFDPSVTPGDLEPSGASTAPVAGRSRRYDWSTNVGYRQSLIGSTTLTPSVSLRGYALRSDSTGNRLVEGPVRLNLNSSLRTEIYGFWPGVGPFSRMRHKISPSISYSYSPTPSVTPEQERIFGAREGREQNRLRLSINQTFEAKYRAEEDSASAGEGADSTDAGGASRSGSNSRKIELLSLSTSAVAYDFVQAREDGYGLTTTSLTHRVGSDLLDGVDLQVRQDLFRQGPGGDPADREFAPHLRRVSASFSLTDDSWLVRALGLGGGEDETVEADSAAADSTDRSMSPDAAGGSGSMMPGSGSSFGGGGSGQVGSWRARLSYSLERPRPELEREGSQMLKGSVSFQPTEKWSVSWNTSYSFTDHEFSDHMLTLSRDLHRWRANFDFTKTQNGNLRFYFRVQLRDNQDLKVDYEQRGGAFRRRP